MKSMNKNDAVPKVYHAETGPKTLSHPFVISSWLRGCTLSCVFEETCSENTDAALGQAVGKVLAKSWRKLGSGV